VLDTYDQEFLRGLPSFTYATSRLRILLSYRGSIVLQRDEKFQQKDIPAYRHLLSVNVLFLAQGLRYP
jgi:hypothetical protein